MFKTPFEQQIMSPNSKSNFNKISPDSSTPFTSFYYQKNK